jgi:hypothetical protein
LLLVLGVAKTLAMLVLREAPPLLCLRAADGENDRSQSDATARAGILSCCSPSLAGVVHGGVDDVSSGFDVYDVLNSDAAVGGEEEVVVAIGGCRSTRREATGSRDLGSTLAWGTPPSWIGESRGQDVRGVTIWEASFSPESGKLSDNPGSRSEATDAFNSPRGESLVPEAVL